MNCSLAKNEIKIGVSKCLQTRDCTGEKHYTSINTKWTVALFVIWKNMPKEFDTPILWGQILAVDLLAVL